LNQHLSFESQTQAFSTWGNKLLQHTDVLYGIQNKRHFKPITIQLGPTELCDSDCPFCSVQNRPTDQKIPFDKIAKGLFEFRELGAKSLELTGGGNPCIYRDGQRNINDIIRYAHGFGYEIGIITNSHDLPRHIDSKLAKLIKWIRVSLIKLDEGKAPLDYNFKGFEDKIAFSYIVYGGTTVESVNKIAELVKLWPTAKFVRIAADCLTEESITIKDKWGDVIKAIDSHGKFFIKEIGSNFRPFQGGCWMGMIRPYWVHDGIYICTSHVLKHRVYHPTWKLCGHDNITETWAKMNERFAAGQSPYPIDIGSECWHCYYANNNQILSNVINEMPDKNFA
jgi:hypothetical protein